MLQTCSNLFQIVWLFFIMVLNPCWIYTAITFTTVFIDSTKYFTYIELRNIY